MALFPLQRRSPLLDPQGLDDESGHGITGILLLTCDQVSVSDRVGLEPACDNEVRPLQFPRLLLDPERLNAFANEIIGILLLRICETRPGLSFNEESSINLRLQQNGGCVTEDGSNFPRFVR